MSYNMYYIIILILVYQIHKSDKYRNENIIFEPISFNQNKWGQ